MQNWNQRPVPSGAVSNNMPPPPAGYVNGQDPMATMQAYMQYYNQPVSISVLCLVFFLF